MHPILLTLAQVLVGVDMKNYPTPFEKIEKLAKELEEMDEKERKEEPHGWHGSMQ